MLAVQTGRSSGWRQGFKTLRDWLGSALLLDLAILVAAGISHAIAVAPTLENVGALGLIVLIRAFLSFSLQLEMEGSLPWRNQQARHIATPLHRED